MVKRSAVFFTLAVFTAFSLTLSNSQEEHKERRQTAEQWLRQGDEAFERGDYIDASGKYEKSLEISEQINDKKGMAEASSHLGQVYSGLGQYEKAFAFLNKALMLHADIGDKKGGGWDMTRMAAVEINRGRYGPSLNLSEQALKIHEESGDRKGIAEALRNIGSAHKNVGEQRKAFEYGERSLKIAEEIGDKRAVATTLNSLGVMHQEFGSYAQALEYYRRSRMLAGEIGDERVIAATLNNTGLLHRELGDYLQAMEYHQQSLKIKQEIGDKRGVGTSLHNIGEVDISLGHYAEALEHHQKALQIFEEIGANRELAQSLSTMGMVYRNLGNYARALEYYKRSLKIREEIGDKNGTAQSLHGMANIHASLGHYTEALNYHEKALKLKEEIGNQRTVSISLHDIGSLHAGRGRYDQALAYYQKALRIREDLGDKSGVAQILSSMGSVYYQRREMSEAYRNLSEAIRMAEQMGRQDILFSSLYRRGLVLRDTGRPDEAVRSLKAAVQVIEQVRRRIPLVEQRAEFLQEKLEVYESLIGLLARAKDSEDTFHYAERAKARAFLDLLTEAKAEIRKKISPELLERERRTLAKLLHRQRLFQEEAAKKNRYGKRMAELQEQLRSADQEYQDLKLEIRHASPEYAAIRYPEPIRLEQAKRLLDDQEVMLEYVLGQESSLLLAVTKTDFQVYLLPKREQLERKTEAFANLLAQLPTESGTLAYVTAAYDLYKLLVKPAQKQIEGKRSITIVPDGALALLPFQALLTEKVGLTRTGQVPINSLPYMVRAYDISYIQSASILQRVKQKERGGVWAQKLVGFAPINFDGLQVAEGGLKNKDPIEAGIEDLYRSGVRLGNLPYTKKELEWIKDLYGDKQTRLYMGQEATEERVKDSDLKNYRYVHFATHGIMHTDRPEFSSIVLRSEGREDGYLQVAEILNLELDADLVVLSACQSGKGNTLKGEGLIGLTRGFMYAGAASVLASLWNVQDRPTAHLMREFYN